MKEYIENLYATDEDFKEYVHKFMTKHKLTLEEALNNSMIREYARWVRDRI